MGGGVAQAGDGGRPETVMAEYVGGREESKGDRGREVEPEGESQSCPLSNRQRQPSSLVE